MSQTGSTTLTGNLGPASPLPSPKLQNSGLGALPRQIRADCRFYVTLRHPSGCGTLRSLLTCLGSRGLLVLAAYRLSHYYYSLWPRTSRTPWTVVLRLLILVGRTLAIVLAKSDIYYATVIDEGVHLSNDGQQIIGARRIGRGTIIHDSVTIGFKAGADSTRPMPTVGENVWIGSDCVIYGDITIGDGATILPETVLSMNVPSGAVVAGNPARIIAREFDNASLRHSLGTAVTETQFRQPCAPSVT
jgi:serine acetyltransferase